MKFLISIVLLICTISVFAQHVDYVDVINETFNNNENKWEIGYSENRYNCSIDKGELIIENFKQSDDFFFYPKIKDLSRYDNYKIEANLKIDFNEILLNNYSGAGFVFINNETGKGAQLYLYKDKDGYFFSIIDNNGVVKLQSNSVEFNEDIYHNIRIIINNETPTFELFFDGKSILKSKFTWFNFKNVCLGAKGLTTVKVKDYLLSTSRTKTSADVDDVTKEMSEYDNSNKLRLELSNIIPDYLVDENRFLKEVFKFEDLYKKIILDEDCYDFNESGKEKDENGVEKSTLYFKYKSSVTIYIPIIHQADGRKVYNFLGIQFSSYEAKLDFFNKFCEYNKYKIDRESYEQVVGYFDGLLIRQIFLDPENKLIGIMLNPSIKPQ